MPFPISGNGIRFAYCFNEFEKEPNFFRKCLGVRKIIAIFAES